jgi:hypothetical protein
MNPAQQLHHEELMGYLENTDLAKRLWIERVSDAMISEELSTWQCGSTACFGGHLATWPEFKAKGVKALSMKQTTGNGVGMVDGTMLFVGEPYMRAKGNFPSSGYDVARDLFGTGELFMPRGQGRYDAVIEDATACPEELTDRQWVVERLQLHREYLLGEINANRDQPRPTKAGGVGPPGLEEI